MILIQLEHLFFPSKIIFYRAFFEVFLKLNFLSSGSPFKYTKNFTTENEGSLSRRHALRATGVNLTSAPANKRGGTT